MQLNNLIENLETQVECHQTLLHLLQQEAELPANCTVKELDTIHRQRDRLVRKVFKQEQTRIQIIKKYSQEKQSSEQLSLQEIIESCDQRWRNSLTELRSHLIELVDKIQTVGHDIAERAVNRMNCITEVQTKIQRAMKRQTTYSKRGVINRPKGAVVMQRAI
ncbi:MAG: hypothetical protein COB67_03285 [SAR324 cluster bacterium]|uniref:Flagellar protein FlgN n=1 Tax=SAR324 cluster bacterium TaxID=2024889 RepID=A0A2A4T8D9_9DELT|nr:MAG: hypothetical protein COB67_03285 [SAR324 cluster bacterium]